MQETKLKLKQIKLECEIITPLVMGGAEMQSELRSQSFNGLFRYWFRLLGGTIEDEKRLFGWGGEKANKGIVKITLGNNKKIQEAIFEKIFDDKGNPKREKGINYLGFSLDTRPKKDREGRRREYLIEGETFDLEFLFYPKSTEDDIKKFLSAVWCAFYLGNFGSRSRRGFGSIMVKSINGDIPENFDLSFSPTGNIGDWIKTQLKNIKSLNCWQARKDIPYVFENLEIYKVDKNNFQQFQSWRKEVQKGRRGKFLAGQVQLTNINTVKDLLDFMGNILMAYRSYYSPDYDIAKKIIVQRQKLNNSTIERVIFGLPLNFYFSSARTGGRVEIILNDTKLRRASHVILKVIKWDNNFEGFILLFKPNEKHAFKFLPDKARLVLNKIPLEMPDWHVLDNFINSLKKYNLIKQVYLQKEAKT